MGSRTPRNPLFINTILLGGKPTEKIAAASAAGFDQIELWRQDVEAYDGNPEGLGRWIQQQAMGLTDYQVLPDFDGAPDDIRENKRAEALSMLDAAVKLGATTVLAPASTDRRCIANRINDDMRWLAREAASRQLRIAYEGMAWSTVNFTLVTAWNLVKRLNEPNLGLVVDTFHIFVRSRDASDLDGIPMDRIYLVQLSDLDHGVDRQHVIDTARHHRLLPGYGQFPNETILQRLREANYPGPMGLEVFNDDLKARDPQAVAREGMSALRRVWLI